MCKTVIYRKQYHELPLDKSTNEIQDETQHTKKPMDKYSKYWYLLSSGAVHLYGLACSCGNSPF